MSIDDLDVTVILHRVLALGSDSSVGPKIYDNEIARVPATVETYVHSDLPNGLHCYVVFHIAKNGIPSNNSDEDCKTIDVRKPGKPTGLSAN